MAETTGRPRKLGRGLSNLIGLSPVTVQQPADRKTEDMPNIGESPYVGIHAGPTSERHAGLRMVSVTQIEPSRYQPRRVIDEASVDRLAASIRRAGVMQPVIVRPGAGGRFELVVGERRWRAATKAGLSEIPALVRELSEEESAEWGLVENVQREDLNPMDRAHALRSLCERFSLTHAEAADRVALDRSSVANLIRLTELEEPIQAMVSGGELSMGHGRALLSVTPSDVRQSLAKQAATFGWSVRKLEQACRASMHARRAGLRPDHLPRNAVLADVEKQLAEHLGTKVSVQTDRKGTKGRVVIEFYGLDHFDGVLSRMGVTMRA